MTSATLPPIDTPLTAVSPMVLVVDDEKNIRRTVEMVLTGEGYQVTGATTAEEGLSILARPNRPVDLVLLDVKLPGMSGLEMLQYMRSDDALQQLPVIIISGHATVTDAVTAIRLGASDFFEKPLNRERMLVSVRNVLQTARLTRAVEGLREQFQARYEMIGTTPPMQKLYRAIDRVAPTKASVLITGESGTGKELVSRALHRLSPRTDGPFVKVNCAAIPRELIESELFGHERGAFTGAQNRKRGLFEQAHGGTLFLDEIGDMDLSAQAKVLRALQSGEISRVGSEHLIHVDVRVLAATNKDIAQQATENRFREDLYFRLAVFPIRCPSLRERIDDIPVLSDSFVAAFCKENGLRPMTIDTPVYEALRRRKWPGNVRELKNVIERAAILSGGPITIADLPEDPHDSPFDDDPADVQEPQPDISRADSIQQVAATASSTTSESGRPTLREFREKAERDYIIETLKLHDWNISKTAVALGVERTNLHKKVRSYGIQRAK
ncbi:MAG: sigma-54 dependent transcriptional regulator [Polyangiaceae bacterium]|nr:sigma-54 dependent transcriptional regulator [Polyangiaceae bacterium]